MDRYNCAPLEYNRVWKVEEIGDVSIVLSSMGRCPLDKRTFLPNPTEDFIAKHGRMNSSTFSTMFTTEFKELLYSPETLVLYFEDKVPEWIEVGMQIIY